MQQKTSKLLYEYWDGVRKGRLAPDRFEIEPSRISGLLPETFIIECSELRSYTIRLAGTRICTQIGYELRGTDILDHWSHDDREAIESLLLNVKESGAVAVLKLSASDERGRTVWFEMTLMPLVHTGNSVNRILGCLTAIDPPFWLGTARLRDRTLADFDLLWPKGSQAYAEKHITSNRAPLPKDSPEPRVSGDERRKFRVFEGGLSSRPPDEI